LRCSLDLRPLLVGETRGPDDDGAAVGKVFDGRLGGGELHDDFGFFGWIFGDKNARAAGAAELAEVSA
jgi:hypothetical protein